MYRAEHLPGVREQIEFDEGFAHPLEAVAVGPVGRAEYPVAESGGDEGLILFGVGRQIEGGIGVTIDLLLHAVDKESGRTLGDGDGVVGTTDMHPYRVVAESGPARLNLLLQEGVRFEEGKAVPLGAGFVEVDKGGDVDLVASGPRLEIEMLAEASRRIHLVHAAVECRLLEQAGNEEVFPAGAVVAQQVEPRSLGDGTPRPIDGGKQLVEPAVQPRVLEPHDVQLAATLPAQGYGRVDCPHAIGQSAYGYEPYTLFFHRG